jgi:hypothetical protein
VVRSPAAKPAAAADNIEQRGQVHGPWTLQDINSKAPVEEVFEWDSEDENLESCTKNEDAGQRRHTTDTSIS